MSATGIGGFAARDDNVAESLARRRRLVDRLVQGLCVLATCIGLLALASILLTLLWRGLGGLHLSVLTEITKPPGSKRGGC